MDLRKLIPLHAEGGKGHFTGVCLEALGPQHIVDQALEFPEYALKKIWIASIFESLEFSPGV